jgi:hypothetical protein
MCGWGLEINLSRALRLGPIRSGVNASSPFVRSKWIVVGRDLVGKHAVGRAVRGVARHEKQPAVQYHPPVVYLADVALDGTAWGNCWALRPLPRRVGQRESEGGEVLIGGVERAENSVRAGERRDVPRPRTMGSLPCGARKFGFVW